MIANIDDLKHTAENEKDELIICHGSSKAKAIKNAIGVAIDFAERDVVEHIAGNIVKSRKGNEEI